MKKLSDLIKEWNIKPSGVKRWSKPYGQKGTDFENLSEKKTTFNLKSNFIRIGGKLTEVQKRVTKQMWAKMTDDQKVDALGSATDDVEFAEDHFEDEWNELPDEYTSNMYLPESKLNEAEFKFKSISKAFDYIQDLRGQSMDLEQTMRSTLSDLQDVQMDMEQEAEPEGGPIADKYAREMEYHKRQYNKTKAEFEKVMDEIDKFDANYMG